MAFNRFLHGPQKYTRIKKQNVYIIVMLALLYNSMENLFKFSLVVNIFKYYLI